MSYVRSSLRYPGGKQKALKQIEKQFPKDHVDEYRDVMVGGGSVFLHAWNLGLAEHYWLNDLNKDLMNFWHIVGVKATNRELRELLTEMRKLPVEQLKEQHDTYKKWDDNGDIYGSAFKFFFLNRVTFGGTTESGGFSPSAAKGRFTQSAIDRIEHLYIPLRDTKITNKDFEEVITAPGPDVFLFLDPPYVSASNLYGKRGNLHNKFDHERLANVLRSTEHRFLMTYDDCEMVRDLYPSSQFVIETFDLQYSVGTSRKKGKELFIRNYEI